MPLLLLAALMGLHAGFAWGQSTPSERPNIILISLDAVRADRLSNYGYFRNTTPNIDKLAARSAAFDQAYSHTPWTLGSFTALHTSNEPSKQGIFDWGDKLTDEQLTLAEVLKANGYFTFMCVSMIGIGRESNMAQGFDVVDDWIFPEKLNMSDSITSDRVTNSGLKALKMKSDKPLFLWLHYFDPHDEYMHHKEFHFGSDSPDAYDEEIAFTDYHIGRLLDQVKKMGLMKNSIIVVHADHGEEWGEHGGGNHSVALYEESLRVPLILYMPGIERHRLSEVVMLSDLAPTLLTLAGISVPKEFQGTPIPLADKRFHPASDRTVFLENYCNRLCKRGVRENDWKLLLDCQTNRYELFNLAEDPKEKNPLDPQVYQSVFNRLKNRIHDHFPQSAPEEKKRSISEFLRKQLESLNYLK